MDEYVYPGGSHEPFDIKPPGTAGVPPTCIHATIVTFNIDANGEVFVQLFSPYFREQVLKEFLGAPLTEDDQYPENFKVGSFADPIQTSQAMYKLIDIAKNKDRYIRFLLKADKDLPMSIILGYLDILQSNNINQFTFLLRRKMATTLSL